MKKTNVVHLGGVREALAELDRARAAILAGSQDGFHIAVRSGGEETIFIAGVYRRDRAAASRTMLKASAARMLAEEEPPLFQASKM